MNKPSIAELLIASGYTTFTPALITRAVDTLYTNIGAGLDERDWDTILASDDPLAAAEAGLVAMYSDKEFLLRNADHLSETYGAAQIEYTYRQIAERVGSTNVDDWAVGTRFESATELDDGRVRSQAGSEYEARSEDNGGGGTTAIRVTAANARLTTDAQTLVNATAPTTAGDDTIEIEAAFFTGTTIDGGGGDNTLQVTDGGTFSINNNITNILTLDLAQAAASSSVSGNVQAFENVNLSNAGDTVTITGQQTVFINGGTGDDTVIYESFTAFAGSPLDNPANMNDNLTDQGGTDTVQVNDAISVRDDLSLIRAGGFERLVQNDAGAADFKLDTARADINVIDVSASTANSTVDASNRTDAISIETGTGDDTLTGGSGDDSLTGGVGGDALNGQAGDDSYVYATANDSGVAGGNTIVAASTDADITGAGIDVVTFADGDDTIDLSAFTNGTAATVNNGNTAAGIVWSDGGGGIATFLADGEIAVIGRIGATDVANDDLFIAFNNSGGRITAGADNLDDLEANDVVLIHVSGVADATDITAADFTF